ncbi:MAG: DRTGG domain-containing protein [Syntrophales bacterium]|nr:DRTGG domain-containing protein [Syntrophales bacterium]MCK9527835.1 DRTGG domain-containing protein [Syntrophales bacterium]MDX9922068.1 DRTGG domain-containing protein [Syntrophales bacterium]
MKLGEVVDILEATLLVGTERHLALDVKTAFSADLMSDVLAFAKSGSLILTGLTTPQVVRTASILDATALIIVRGKIPPADTLKLAQELDIPVLSTGYILFETSGRLYANGIVGCIEKIGGMSSAGS